jgi:hypothetical protein
MKNIIFILIFTFVLCIGNVSADVVSIGGTGGDEIILGYGNQIDLFFSGYITDITNPNVTITFPNEGYNIEDYVSGGIPVRVNFSLVEDNIDECFYKLSGSQNISNVSFLCSEGYNDFLIILTTPGSFVITVYVNDTSGNIGYDNVFMSMSAYTGSQQGGPGSVSPGSDIGDLNNTYELEVLCSNIDYFLTNNDNYTYDDKEKLKNSLAIILGFSIGDELLDKYLFHFDEYCSYYKVNDTDGGDVPEDNKHRPNYYIITICIALVLLFVFVLWIIYDKERFLLIVKRIKQNLEKEKNDENK